MDFLFDIDYNEKCEVETKVIYEKKNQCRDLPSNIPLDYFEIPLIHTFQKFHKILCLQNALQHLFLSAYGIWC